MSNCILSIAEELMEFYHGKYPAEVNIGMSETVPGQAMSAKEAVMRADRNLPVTGVGNPEQMPYDGFQKHSPNGEYLGESFDLDDLQMPIFSDDMDIMDFHSDLQERMKEKYPTPPASSAEPPASEPPASEPPASEPTASEPDPEPKS